jgi:hypothetical protein
VFARGVLPLALAPTIVVVALSNLLLALLRATGDEVVRVAVAEAFILRSTMLLVMAVVVKPHEPTGH